LQHSKHQNNNMEKNLQAVFLMSDGMSPSRTSNSHACLFANVTTDAICKNCNVANRYSEYNLNDFAKRAPLLLISLTALFYFFITFSASAQDVLMGLNSNGGPEGKGTAFSIKTDTKAFTVIKGFADWGANPLSDLVRGTDGYLYGMTPNGGTYNHGALFKISAAGDITVLKHFNLYEEGGYPQGSLIQANDGNFYGTLSSGPSSGGAIFKITSGGKFTVIRNLSINVDGGRPHGHLIQAADGNFYGLNTSGGAYGYGTIFKLTAGGQYTVLKSFQQTDGANPYGSLVQASDGALYGMTHAGGAKGYGVIFRITTDGAYKLLRSLNVATDAAYPDGDLIQAKDGWLYGMAPTGINYNGVVFKVNTTGTTLTIIRQLGAGTDGGNPHGSLIQGTDGYFYGLTSISGGGGYAGTAFKMASNGSLTVIKRFTEATDGGGSNGSLIQAPDGTFYGMNEDGGKYAKGTIFKLTSSGSFTVLSHFNGSASGNEPQGNLAIGKDSAYFGVGRYGGAYNSGTIYKICGGVTTVLKSFNRNVDGSKPVGGLVRAKDGNLYGIAEEGGANGVGTIFRITPAGTFTVIRHLNSTTDGGYPKGPLVIGADGYLYGATYSGGGAAGGTIFKISTSGAGFKVLRALSYSTDGSNMITGLAVGKDGNFYGITGANPRFFKVTKDGVFTVIKTISYSTDGGTPAGSLIVGTDGNFYGAMTSGGANSGGIIFKITPTGTITKLRQLSTTTDGGSPKGSLVQGSDGAFYGTNSAGGTYKAGTIFRISGTAYSVLRHLNMATDGGAPMSGLIVAPKIALVANNQSGLTTTEDVAKAITLTGSGATNITFNILIKPRYGSVTSGTTASRTYTPAANFYGVDSFAFTSNLGCLSSAPAWVKITVSAVNDAPVLSAIGNKTVVKGSQLKFIATAKDPDPGQTKTFSLIGAPSGAAISSSTGFFSWTPLTTGTYMFKVRVTDNGSPALYDEEQITVTVTNTITAARELTEKPIMVTEKPLETKMYPNPVNDRFTIAFSKTAERVVAMITDVRGATVQGKNQQQFKVNKLEINVADLKAGTYFVRLQTESGSQVLKFVKM
jgi:uncharacterized repeat protein (TIGR03803 family)